MPFGRFEITITTATQDELDKIATAIFSGYAEHVLKERILWPEYYPTPAPQMQGSQPVSGAMPDGRAERGSVPAGEPAPPLQRIDTHSSAPVVVKQETKPARKTGVLGRGRMGRS